MSKNLVCIIMVLCIGVCVPKVEAQDNQPVSTQGLTLQEGVEKNIKSSKEEIKELHQKKKLKRIYFRRVSDLKAKQYKKSIKERNIEFYNSRLEIKKQKLEELTSDGSKKGEN